MIVQVLPTWLGVCLKCAVVIGNLITIVWLIHALYQLRHTTVTLASKEASLHRLELSTTLMTVL